MYSLYSQIDSSKWKHAPTAMRNYGHYTNALENRAGYWCEEQCKNVLRSCEKSNVQVQRARRNRQRYSLPDREVRSFPEII